MKPTTPALHRDIDAAHKRAMDLKHEHYHERIDRDLALFRAKLLTLALLTALAVLVWSLASTENGRDVCQLIARLFQ
jgi:hypothetical protein